MRPIMILLPILPALCAESRDRVPWPDIPPEQLAIKASAVERDAGAEALLWSAEVDLTNPKGLVYRHHRRIKIFNERGRGAHSTIEIPYPNNVEITELEARTVNQDGSTTQLSSTAFYDRVAVKVAKLQIKVKSFAMPGVEPGSIIEYRWIETHRDKPALNDRLDLQLDIPAREIRYSVKPNPSLGQSVHDICYQCGTPPSEAFGHTAFTMRNVPAFKAEPFMPSESRLRPWILLYTADAPRPLTSEFWKEVSQAVYRDFKSRIKPNDAIRRTVTEVTKDAGADRDKLVALAYFCRKQIRNAGSASSGISAEELSAYHAKNKGAANTLKNGMGTGREINTLFAALASAAGFEVRPTLVSEHKDPVFVPEARDLRMFSGSNMAVKSNQGKWLFFDPASPYLTDGMLRWQEEGQNTMILGPDGHEMVVSPYSTPEASKAHRVAELTLRPDGGLEGTVRVTFTGHLSELAKSQYDRMTESERQERIKAEVLEEMPKAQVSAIEIKPLADLSSPFCYSYKVTVPNFGETTGRRIFFQPAFFQKGSKPLFPASERRHPIQFQFPWSEADEVVFHFPGGYKLESADIPGRSNFGDVGWYEAKARHDDAETSLAYNRKFVWGIDGRVGIDQAHYANLKAVFDLVHAMDNHVLTLRQK